MKKQLYQASVYICLFVTAVLAVACNTNQSPRQQVDDAAITAEIKSKLAADVNLATVTDIEVNTTNGVVSLSGQVESESVKQRAEAVTKQVEGVVRVMNNLQVHPASAG